MKSAAFLTLLVAATAQAQTVVCVYYSRWTAAWV